jgi:hypothetical protein
LTSTILFVSKNASAVCLALLNSYSLCMLKSAVFYISHQEKNLSSGTHTVSAEGRQFFQGIQSIKQMNYSFHMAPLEIVRHLMVLFTHK